MSNDSPYRTFDGMEYAEIPEEIFDRATNPMFAYDTMEDQARLAQLKRDAAYNNRWAVPGYMADLDRWAAESASVRAAVRCDLDVAYGDGERENIDILYPDRDGPVPLIVFLHGGYWMSMTKDSYSFIGKNFVASGAAFAVVGFGLCPDITLAAMTGQVERAIENLWVNADALGFDRERFYLAGHSSGGHLAAMVLGGGVSGKPPVPPENFKASVIVSGLFDLAPIAATYINNYIALDDDGVQQVSPLHHVPLKSAKMGPLILGTGEHELAEYHLHQARYAEAWAANGHDLQMCDAAGYQHFDVPYDLANENGGLHQAFRSLIDFG
ncbi:MAG: alpha/beta hydrolase fold domain-containing protein [Alphaproteobacteria bacterium]|nr:alpha/beta hydrolase fold domain-containing protein [Alphaproteobacteria bacterium]